MGITPYSNSDVNEVKAVYKLHCLVDPNKVKLDINTRDKFPNIDGYMELVTSSGVPEGKLEVQIKKLPKSFDPSNPKIKIQKSLYEYSKKGTSNPVLHVGVDIQNNTAYWIYIHDKLTNTRGKHIINYSGKTTLIPLDLSNIDNGIIRYGKHNYVRPWKLISLKHIKSSTDYEKLKEKFHELEMHSEPTLGAYSDEFVYIHTFLDELNDKLGYFDIIKKRFYFTDTWKLGLVYKNFPNNGLGYALFPIPFNKNDIQIKKIKLGKDILDGFRQLGLFKMIGHLGSNPMKSNPEGYAKQLIEENIRKILKDKLLIICNEFIAREILFSVLNTSYTAYISDNQNSFKIEDIRKMDSERKLINRSYDSFNEKSFIEAINFLDSKGIKEINRIYIPRDWKKNSKGVEIGKFSPDSMRRNLETIFNNLLSVYTDILSCNFPRLSNELSLFGDASKLIVSYYNEDDYDPKLNIFYLKSDEPEDFEIKFYMKEQPFTTNEFRNKFIEFRFENKNPRIKFENKLYKPLNYSEEIPTFIYSDTPMLSFIYRTLENRFQKFFKNWEKNSDG